MVATEIGFTKGDMSVNQEYGKAILDNCESRGISWIAWVIDPEWHPNMIDSWEKFTPTDNGKMFIDFMTSKKKYPLVSGNDQKTDSVAVSLSTTLKNF